MIAYVSGTKKATGSTSNAIHQKSLRRVSAGVSVNSATNQNKSTKHNNNKGKRKTSGAPRLNDQERAEFERSIRKGFVTLACAPGNRRRGTPLVTHHRQWCDARTKPQICVYKATGGCRPLDQVVVDLSPLRLYGLLDDAIEVEDYTVRWKAEILTVASGNSMRLCGNIDEFSDDDDDEDLCQEECELETSIADARESVILEVTPDTREAWSTKPIGELPQMSLIFQGERSNAKAMAKALAILWDVPEKVEAFSSSRSKRDSRGTKSGKNKTKGIRQHRKRGGGHRQAYA